MPGPEHYWNPEYVYSDMGMDMTGFEKGFRESKPDASYDEIKMTF